ncbi:hypothetical protein GH714_027359 [Hevea brasiliensis]|uniref:Uncharacterized protein n=1 Tax=Hevea brasiliensis TaxID=3981 RepID=A0A6A6MAJ1_HEVBR|nr:hypothetical protein GH714_027359 [Hevea brasiliensis]
MRWVNNKRPPCKSTGEALGSATGPSGATGRHWALPRAVGGATGRNWALPRARRGQLGGTGHCHGPIEGSNWEALGTATGLSGATGKHWALPRAVGGATGRHWALPRARRGQLGGTGHCHGLVGGNWEALGTATGRRGQLGGTVETTAKERRLAESAGKKTLLSLTLVRLCEMT